MKLDATGKIIANSGSINFPNLISEGRKYGLSEVQISQLQRYLNDRRMLRLISLESFNRNARAWLSALTGIVAEILAMDAHFSIWLDRKTEKPRNWILKQLNNVVPTKIDDVAIKTIQLAQEFMDSTMLPLKEKVAANISSKMHDKYTYHANANYLGTPIKELKENAKAILRDSKEGARDAMDVIKQRKFETHVMKSYRDEAGNRIDMRKYGKNTPYKYLMKGKDGNAKRENKQEQKDNKQELQQEEFP